MLMLFLSFGPDFVRKEKKKPVVYGCFSPQSYCLKQKFEKYNMILMRKANQMFLKCFYDNII